jgi:hypothetical protein
MPRLALQEDATDEIEEIASYDEGKTQSMMMTHPDTKSEIGGVRSSLGKRSQFQ